MAPSPQQGNNYLIYKYLLFLLCCERLSHPWKPQGPSPYLSSGWHTDLILVFFPWTSHVCGVSNPLMCVGFLYIHNEICFSPVNLFCVNVIPKLARKTSKGRRKVYVSCPAPSLLISRQGPEPQREGLRPRGERRRRGSGVRKCGGQQRWWKLQRPAA